MSIGVDCIGLSLLQINTVNIIYPHNVISDVNFRWREV